MSGFLRVFCKKAHVSVAFRRGPLSKLVAVLVDGQKLDAKQYTAASGSTIITLAADYVQTLATGEHTLTVRYTARSEEGVWGPCPQSRGLGDEIPQRSPIAKRFKKKQSGSEASPDGR